MIFSSCVATPASQTKDRSAGQVLIEAQYIDKLAHRSVDEGPVRVICDTVVHQFQSICLRIIYSRALFGNVDCSARM